MKSSLKNFFRPKRASEGASPRMEQDDEIKEIMGLDDACVDALSSIERDAMVTLSSAPSFPMPPLQKEAYRDFVKSLDDDFAVAIAFLINNDAGQAHSICKKIEAGTFVPANFDMTPSQYLFEILLKTAESKNLKEGWHVKFLAAVCLIGRLKKLYKEIYKTDASAENLVVKDAKFEEWSERLRNPRYEIIHRDRVQIFEICQNLTTEEAADLYSALKNDFEQSSTVAKDAIPTQQLDLETFRYAETKFLELLMLQDSSQLVKKIEKCLRQIVKDLDEDEFRKTFNPIFNNPRSNSGGQEARGQSTSCDHKLKRGLCLIINNEEFEKGKFSKREGSTKDANDLEKVWKRFNCNVRKLKNLTQSQMMEELKKFQAVLNEKHAHEDSFFFTVICILSHGRRRMDGVEEIMGIDGLGVATETITDMFVDAEKCPGMAGKVKVFLLQACRGDDSHDTAVAIPANQSQSQSQSTVTTDGATARPSVPRKSWYIISHSTLKGSVSYRDRNSGSFFIQAICGVLEDMVFGKGPRYDLLNVMNVANRSAYGNLKAKSNRQNEQVGEVTHSLMGVVYLPDPVNP